MVAVRWAIVLVPKVICPEIFVEVNVVVLGILTPSYSKYAILESTKGLRADIGQG